MPDPAPPWLPLYRRLPAEMRPVQAPEGPAPGHTPRLAFFQEELAAGLGLEDADASLFAGGTLPPAEEAEPVALAYMGHQFGNLTVLGDGRAVLLGGRGGPRGVVDVQLKGSGRTPFSRGGDGRAALGPMLREALFSEAVHALGVPTTRTLAVATTGREADRRGLPPAWTGEGAALTRVAASHLRVGTFVLAAHLGVEALAATLDEAVARHDPDLAEEPDAAARALAFLRRVVDRQAALVAQWMSLGFVHGVLNTDNVAVSGETIDYGPCAFVDAFHRDAVFSSIDRGGRYRLSQQPAVTGWNLTRLAEALLPLLAPDPEAAVPVAEEALAGFASAYGQAYAERMRAKLGLAEEREGDAELIDGLLDALQADRLDWTSTFRHLAGDPEAAAPGGDAFAAWRPRWEERLGGTAPTGLLAVNPATVPRSHHAAAAIEAALNGDPTDFEGLLVACRNPFERHPRWSQRPASGAAPVPTFCGT